MGFSTSTCTACWRSEEHTSELQSRRDLVCRLLLEKKKKKITTYLLKKKKKNKICINTSTDKLILMISILLISFFFYSISINFFFFLFFFFNDTATTEIYTLSLHDALPILMAYRHLVRRPRSATRQPVRHKDRKSTRLNSSHVEISYAVFCLKKKKIKLLEWLLYSRRQGEVLVNGVLYIY